METNELEQIWERDDARLERCLRVNEVLLRTVAGDRARNGLADVQREAASDTLFGALATVGLAVFGSVHRDEPATLATAIALFAAAAFWTALAATRRRRIARVDFEGPVAAIQRELESIQLAHYRASKWTLTLGVLLWAHILAVGVRALLGVDLLTKLPTAWWVANLAVGGVVLVAVELSSRRWVEPRAAGGPGHALIDGLSGRRLREARQFLRDLARFEE